jgi:hypothetical protein
MIFIFSNFNIFRISQIKLVVTNVNGDRDNREGYHGLGSGGAEKVQGATGVVSQSGSGVAGEVEVIGVVTDGSSQRLGGPSGGVSDPAQLVVGEVVCVKKRAGKKKGVGPKSNKGVLPLVGPNTLNLAVPEEGGGVCSKEGEKLLVSNQIANTSTSLSNGTQKKVSNRRNFPNLPYNMLRKIPGACQGNKKSKQRKDGCKDGGHRRGVEDVSCSDPIQNSPLVVTQRALLPTNSGVGLEVVLPFDFEDGLNVVLSNGGGTSGAVHLMEGGGFIPEDVRGDGVVVPNSGGGGSGDSQGSDRLTSSRDEAVARKLISINQELGVNFSNDVDLEVARMVLLEVRDREEKVGREQNGGYQ